MYDALARLHDVGVAKESGSNTNLDIGRYIRLGPLGTALLPYRPEDTQATDGSPPSLHCRSTSTGQSRNREQTPSRTPLIDQLLDRNIQRSALSEFLEALDRFAPTVWTAPPDWDQPSDGLAVLSDRDLLAALDALQQGGKMSFSLVGADFVGHSIIQF